MSLFCSIQNRLGDFMNGDRTNRCWFQLQLQLQLQLQPGMRRRGGDCDSDKHSDVDAFEFPPNHVGTVGRVLRERVRVQQLPLPLPLPLPLHRLIIILILMAMVLLQQLLLPSSRFDSYCANAFVLMMHGEPLHWGYRYRHRHRSSGLFSFSSSLSPSLRAKDNEQDLVDFNRNHRDLLNHRKKHSPHQQHSPHRQRRRFLQAVHPSPISTSTSTSFTPSRNATSKATTTVTVDEAARTTSTATPNRIVPVQRGSSSSGINRSSSSSSSNRKPQQPHNKENRRRNRSIEDLESVLMQRYGPLGTHPQNTWTSIDDDDDDDDDDDLDSVHTINDCKLQMPHPQPQQSQSQTQPRKMYEIGRQLRARPVPDPWDENVDEEEDLDWSDEHLEDKDKKKKVKEEKGKKKGPRERDSHTTRNDSDNDTNSPGFFFLRRPPAIPTVNPTIASHEALSSSKGATVTTVSTADAAAAAAATATAAAVRSEKKKQKSTIATTTAEESSKSKSKKSNPVVVESIPVPTGRLLTLDEARRRYDAVLQQPQQEPQSRATFAATTDGASSSQSASQSVSQWRQLGVTHPLLLENLQRMQCHQPLHVQNQTLSLLLLPDSSATTHNNESSTRRYAEEDIIIGTNPGSGKTLSFLVPLIQRLFDSLETHSTSTLLPSPRVLVVAPSRELASQIASVARNLIQTTKKTTTTNSGATTAASTADAKVSSSSIPTVMLALGGTTFSRNLLELRRRKPHLVVGTPGRLAELLLGTPGGGGGAFSKSSKGGGGGRWVIHKNNNHPIRTLVLDEFDALLQYAPHRDKTLAVWQHLSKSNPSLQTIVCSATARDMMMPKQSPIAAVAAEDDDAAAASTTGQKLKQRERNKRIDQFLRPGYRTVMALSNDDEIHQDQSEGSTAATRSITGSTGTVLHGVVHVEHRRFALDMVRRILHTSPPPQQMLIFVSNARRVSIVVDKLRQSLLVPTSTTTGSNTVDSATTTATATATTTILPLSGDEDKLDRADTGRALREGRIGIVVATELAARGLDVPFLSHVINVDLPTDASHYAHRAGRTGRKGNPGVVINLTCRPQERKVPQKFADQLGIEMLPVLVQHGQLQIMKE